MTMNMRFFIIAAAATLLAACTQENEVQNNPVEARITAGVSGPKTRAVDNGWNADRIGVMVVDAPGTTTTMGGKYKNVGYATTSTGTNADFTPMTAGGGIFFEDAFLEFTFAAYAPYASGANASTLPGTDGKITVNTSNQPTTTEQEKVDYIHATGAMADKDSPTVSFTDNTAAGGSDCSFKHKMARLILKVQVSNTDGFDDTAVLEFADYKLGGLVHEGTFDVKTGTAATAGSVVSDWMLRQCTGAPKTATDKCVATFDAATGVMTFTMILLPQTLANALVLEVSPDDGEYQSYSNKDMIKPALEAGYSYTYTITVKKTGLTLSGSTIENWNDGGSHAGDAKM
ncbi:fimbrillin family protein [Odoribacter splanchnicus]|uniref:fimbrillin family protein n=1 Tax=Odoribacter splanchnicus TaxID=28118 RepID=UPI001899EB4E|nr:fimbrillin family protein [Odoribacter splanchnicus]MDB9231208.1 fimbrillin family protein [Odoribacter splanchnicus]